MGIDVAFIIHAHRCVFSSFNDSISKKFMESLGGSLDLSEKMLDGYNCACFKLELPIKT